MLRHQQPDRQSQPVTPLFRSSTGPGKTHREGLAGVVAAGRTYVGVSVIRVNVDQLAPVIRADSSDLVGRWLARRWQGAERLASSCPRISGSRSWRGSCRNHAGWLWLQTAGSLFSDHPALSRSVPGCPARMSGPGPGRASIRPSWQPTTALDRFTRARKPAAPLGFAGTPRCCKLDLTVVTELLSSIGLSTWI